MTPLTARELEELAAWAADTHTEPMWSHLVQRLIAQARGQSWQAIETAPKYRHYIGGFIDDHGELRVVKLCYGDWSFQLTHWLDGVDVPVGDRFGQSAQPSEPTR